MVPLFFHLLPNFSGTVPAGNHSPIRGTLPLCISYCIFISPSDFKYPGLSWCGTTFPALRGEGAAKLQLLIQLSSIAPAAATVLALGARPGTTATLVPAQVPGNFPSLYKLLPSIFQHPLQSLASKLHISWDSIGCSLCSSEGYGVITF